MIEEYKDKYYYEWLRPDGSLNPDKTSGSFNNIVYLLEFVMGANYFIPHNDEIYLFDYHVTVNKDSNGLYIPKNSHDNMTALICGSVIFDRTYHKDLNLFQACKEANFHPRDVILYVYLCGGKLTSFIASLFLPILGLIIVSGAMSSGKIRPKDWLIKLMFNKHKLLSETPTKDGWIRKYLFISSNMEYDMQLMQNDGKPLSFIRLAALIKTSKIMRLFARLYENVMIRSYGEQYVGQMFYRYFPEGWNHPVPFVWKGISRPFARYLTRL